MDHLTYPLIAAAAAIVWNAAMLYNDLRHVKRNMCRIEDRLHIIEAAVARIEGKHDDS